MISMMEYRDQDNVGFYFNEKNTFGMSNNQLSIVSPNKKLIYLYHMTIKPF